MIETVLRIALNLLALAINLGLVYFVVRLIFVFRGGRAELSWRYILTGVLALAVASILFTLTYLLNLGKLMHYVGSAIMVIGGASLLAGIYTEYKRWTGG